jgi:hypothetical protein
MSSLSSKQGPRYRHTSGDTEPYETIGVEKLTPIIGAEISGVDLAGTLSNRTMDEIHRALAENLVIFFRDQHITPQQHLAFGRRFGDLHIHPAAPHEGDDPALMKIYADKDSPRANGEGWHTDVSCDVEPPMGSILYIKQCPPRGGDTLFANMYAAYEALSDRMKAYLHGLTALHDGEQTYRGLYANYGVADRAGLSARRASGGAHPSRDGQEGALRQPRLHALPDRRPPRRERRHAGLSLPARGKSAVPVPLPLERKRHRVLGQPLRPASRDVGLLAAYARRHARDGEGGEAGLVGDALTLGVACAKLGQQQNKFRRT